MTRETWVTKVIIPIICSIIAFFAGIIGGYGYQTYQTSKTNINIVNTINANFPEGTPGTSLELSTTNLIDAYNSVKHENEAQVQQIDDLKNDYEQSQEKLELLRIENERLSQENDKLKTFLLHDNTYAEDIDDLVIVKETFKRLESLSVNDSHGYNRVDGVKDYHGDTHGVSYRLHAGNTAFVEYKLAGAYDLFNANIITTLETGSYALFSIEAYLDDNDIPVKRIDDITRDTNLIPLGPIVVTGVDRLRIKVIKLEGSGWDDAICYITDDALSVVQ